MLLQVPNPVPLPNWPSQGMAARKEESHGARLVDNVVSKQVISVDNDVSEDQGRVPRSHLKHKNLAMTILNRQCGLKPKFARNVPRGIQEKVVVPLPFNLCCESPFNEKYGCRECHLCRFCGTQSEFHLPYGNRFNRFCFKCAGEYKKNTRKRARCVFRVEQTNTWGRMVTYSENSFWFPRYSVEFLCPHDKLSYRQCKTCLEIVGHVVGTNENDMSLNYCMFEFASGVEDWYSILFPYLQDHFFSAFLTEAQKKEAYDKEQTLWEYVEFFSSIPHKEIITSTVHSSLHKFWENWSHNPQDRFSDLMVEVDRDCGTQREFWHMWNTREELQGDNFVRTCQDAGVCRMQ